MPTTPFSPAAPPDSTTFRLVAKLGWRAPTTDPRVVKAAVAQLVNAAEQLEAFDPARARAELARWLGHERARDLAGAGRRNAARVHGRAIATTVGTVARAPAHERAHVAIEAQRAIAEHASPTFAQRSSPSNLRSQIPTLHAAIPLLLVVFCSRDATTNRDSV